MIKTLNARVLGSPVLLASVWMLGALLSLVLLAVSAREMSVELSTIEILFLRSVVSLGLVLALLPRLGWRQLRTEQFGTHLSRNVAHLCGQYAWIYGIAHISLAEVFALEFTTPIWATLIAAVVLGEKITRYRLVALVLGMIGVLLIVRPGFVEIRPATLVVLGSAVAFALAHILTKKLVGRHSALSIIFYMTVIHLLLSAIPALLNWVTPSAQMWPWIVTMALVSISAHFCMAKAFAQADAMVVVPMDFLRLPLAAMVGYVFYNESMAWIVLLGAAVMFGGNLINIVAERRLRST
ncbi:MAG: DMT family transporter [Pseudomonadales bacterium]|nr:DMT family transporter [Pseudomonadales bacterium]